MAVLGIAREGTLKILKCLYASFVCKRLTCGQSELVEGLAFVLSGPTEWVRSSDLDFLKTKPQKFARAAIASWPSTIQLTKCYAISLLTQ